MQTVIKDQEISLFSKLAAEKQVEISFVGRLFHLAHDLTMAQFHGLVNSGEFNKVFPAIVDETSPVAPRRFEDLKPFSFQDWSDRNRS